MFNMEVKMKFIELKAAGLPMYKIANELGVHRATIMRWNKELAPYILIARQDAIDEMLFENDCMRINRIEKISQWLSLHYSMLDLTKDDKSIDVNSILGKIERLTKLLMLEANAKSAEASMKIDKESFTELSESEDDFENTVWVTDKEKFTRYEPDDEIMNKPKKEIAAFAEDIVKTQVESGGFRNSKYETVQDISEKAPELQKIFNKSMARSGIFNEPVKTEKCNNNVTMKAVDIKLRKKTRQ